MGNEHAVRIGSRTINAYLKKNPQESTMRHVQEAANRVKLTATKQYIQIGLTCRIGCTKNDVALEQPHIQSKIVNFWIEAMKTNLNELLNGRKMHSI